MYIEVSLYNGQYAQISGEDMIQQHAMMWKNSDVVPVPKNTSSNLININNDLRPISLTHTISKVLESFVAEWMIEATQSVTNFDEKQFCGLHGRSTVHVLIEVHSVYMASGT